MEDGGRRRWFDPDHFGALLGVVLLTFFTTPLAYQSELGAATLGVQSAVVVLLTFRACDVSRRWLTITAVVVSVTSVVLAIEAVARAGAPPAWPSATLTVLLGITPFLVLRRVLRMPRVTVSSIAGSLSAYLLLGLAFGSLFLTMSIIDPDAFSEPLQSTSTYFSFVTLVTLGYGDIVPVSDLARSMATLEAVLGQVLLVTLVARSVSTLGQEPVRR